MTHPDNTSTTDDGALLVASQQTQLWQSLQCADLQPGQNCLLPFNIMRIDPNSGLTEIVFASKSSALPVATVGLQVADDLFLGTYAGDRIVKIKGSFVTP